MVEIFYSFFGYAQVKLELKWTKSSGGPKKILDEVYMAAAGIAFMLLVLFVIGIHVALGAVNGVSIKERVFSKVNNSASARKLPEDSNDDDGGSMNRIGATCSKDNILVFQGATSPLPNGIPTYTVQIQNVCVSGSCSISNIHLSCGWFSSARLINPSVFRRVDYDDCLVNDGEPLNPGQCLTFQYANSFQYPLTVSSVTCY